MFQRKTRVFRVLALAAILSLAPFAEASAADGEGSLGLVAQVEAEIASLWTSLTSIWGEVGVRIDDNG